MITPGADLIAGIHDPGFAIIVLANAPLAAVPGNIFPDDIGSFDAKTVGVRRHVNPIIEGPDNAAGLMFEISAAASAVVPQYFFIGDAVLFRVLI